MIRPLLFLLGIVLALPLAAQQPGLDKPTPFNAFSNGLLPQQAPGSSTGWSTENAFPNLTFIDPIWLTPVPGTTDFLLVGKDGQIWRFANDPGVTQGQVVPVLDWRAHTQTGEDMGFYHLIFHPNFGQPGQIGENHVYVCYNQKPGLAGQGIDDSYWRVSRFTWVSASGTIDPGSEEILINQYDPQQWHNGGAMFFDNEGFLNVTCGDGEFDYWHQDQNGPINGGFFGGLFRIDVDYPEAIAANPAYSKSHAIRRQPLDIPTGGLARQAGWPASSTQGYGIPETNPWLDPGGSILEEFVVHGLRSPHTAHYDPVENEIWLGDVGGGLREELDRLRLGDNAQWPIREGINGGAEPPGAVGTWTAPFLDYGHSCIIGGMRYRGTKWNTLLDGRVLYGDILQGKIWTASILPSGDLDQTDLIIDGFHANGGKKGLANFCTDDAGEIYLMDLNGTNSPGGTIQRLVSSGVTNEPPQFLSQTGLFSNMPALVPAAGVIPYDVETPLWSDAAHKKRWIALPNNGTHDNASEQIVFDEEYNWIFPAGTVLVKHFELPTDENDPTKVKRLETRLIVCTAGGGKYGVTYKWNASGTDAELLTGGASESVTINLSGGGTSVQNWDYPSRGDCLQCHNSTSGQALGVRTTQLNRDFFYPATGRTANQLLTFNALGMFDQTLSVTQLANFIESRAIDDETAPVEHRVRSYLDSNCSHCHRPGGTVPYFDARLGTPLDLQGIVNGTIAGHFELPGGNYIKPGDTALSAIHVRASNVGNGIAMPPLAKNLADQKAIDLISNYINGLNPAEFVNSGTVQARYVRLTATSEVNGYPWTSVAELSILDEGGNPITSGVSVSDVDSQETNEEQDQAAKAIDGDINTFWHTDYSTTNPDTPHPHHITLDLGSVRGIGGFSYTPRQNLANGRIADYQVHYSSNGGSWTLMESGTWPDGTGPQTYAGLVGLRKARCEIAGPAGTINSPFEVTVAFDKDVTDFTAGDLTVYGGSVTALRGSGYYYVATISPSQPLVTVVVPADSANTNMLGSFVSNTLDLGHDSIGPVASFTGIPAGGIVTGPFTLGIEFDEPPLGFSSTSLSATHADLLAFSGNGTSYSVVVSPQVEGPFSVTLSPAGITDSLANASPAPVVAVLDYAASRLFAEAESGLLTGGMTMVSDPNASAGNYIWLPEGTSPGNENTFNSANSATYTFVVPHGGNWILEGLLRSENASSDSLWVKVDGGTTYNWETNAGEVGSNLFTWDQLNQSGSTGTATILIDTDTNNGSFEYAGGILNTAKIVGWDTNPDVDAWSEWNAATGGPSTSEIDSGVQNTGNQTDGSMIAFMQPGNAIYNLTDHIVQEGDVFTFTWDHVFRTASHTVSLVYENDGSIAAIASSAVTSANVGNSKGGTYTIPPGSPAIGNIIGLGVVNTSVDYPELDHFVLTVTHPTVLIGPATNNGGFEQLAGATGSNAKAKHWDTSPNGDVDNWTFLSGPSDDSGTQAGPTTEGSRFAFLQPGNSTYNLTNHIIAEGDVFTYSWDWALEGQGNAIVHLAYQNGPVIAPIDGTGTTNPGTTIPYLGIGTTWTVPSGDPSIGHPVALVATSQGHYPHLDNFNLTVETSIPETVEDPVVLALSPGVHTITIYGREDGTRLDALRLLSKRPLVALNAPAVVIGGGIVTVNVEFSEPVTGLTPGDFSLTGASVSSLTGSGSSYILTLSPIAPLIAISLPAATVIDGDGDANEASNTFLIEIRTLFEQWAIDNNLGTVGYEDDTDGDGLNTLLEFLLNLDPNTPGATYFDPFVGPKGLPRVTMVDAGSGARRLRIEFPRNAAAVAAGYQYIGQFSDNLTDWTDVSTGALAPLGDGWDHMTIEDTENTNTRIKRYARLKVLAPQ